MLVNSGRSHTQTLERMKKVEESGRNEHLSNKSPPKRAHTHARACAHTLQFFVTDSKEPMRSIPCWVPEVTWEQRQ